MDNKPFSECFDVGLLISLRVQLMFTVAHREPHQSAFDQFQHQLKYNSENFFDYNCRRYSINSLNNSCGLEEIIRKIGCSH